MKQDIIIKLRNRIQEHINNGGNIYQVRRTLPYYDILNRYYKLYRETENPDATMEDMYALCGFEFDREYYRYTQFIKSLEQFADENNHIDSIKKFRGKNSPLNQLNVFAKDIGSSPTDYLILMTDYRFEKAIVPVDYIAHLNQELQEKYPDGDVSRIKQENKSLYFKLAHFQKYAPEPLTKNETLDFFRLKGSSSRFYGKAPIHPELDQKVLIEIARLYPGNEIHNLSTNHPALYRQANLCAVSHDQTLEQWISLNLNKALSRVNHNSRLSRAQVDAVKREEELMSAMNSIIEKNNIQFSDNLTDIQKYRLRKKLAQLTIDQINEINSPLMMD